MLYRQLLRDSPTIFLLEGYFLELCACCILLLFPCDLYLCLFCTFNFFLGTVFLLAFVAFLVQDSCCWCLCWKGLNLLAGIVLRSVLLRCLFNSTSAQWCWTSYSRHCWGHQNVGWIECGEHFFGATDPHLDAGLFAAIWQQPRLSRWGWCGGRESVVVWWTWLAEQPSAVAASSAETGNKTTKKVKAFTEINPLPYEPHVVLKRVFASQKECDKKTWIKLVCAFPRFG